jgi:DNA-binding PadR family transcriptional regulator
VPKGDHLGEFEQLVLLAVLRCEASGEPPYGMVVVKELNEFGGRKAAIGAVYGSLDRLEEKGLVYSWRGEPDPVRGGRARRYFRVEAEGRRALAAARAVQERMWDGVQLDIELAT